MRQSRLLSIIDRLNARGGSFCHHRRWTGIGWLQRWTCKFFDVADVGGCREGDGGWIDGIGTSGDAFGCWEEGAKGLGSIG